MPLSLFLFHLRRLAGHEPGSAAAFWSAPRAQRFLATLVVLPAVLVIISLAFAAIQMIGINSQKANWYKQHAELAMASRDYSTARICYTGLLEDDPANPAHEFGLARSLAALGRTAEAVVLISRLAPADAAGYPPAHLAVAEQLLSAKAPTDSAMAAAEGHLLHVIQLQPGNARAHALLATVYARGEHWNQFKEHLAQGGPGVDRLGLLASDLFAAHGETIEAEAWARRAARFYRARLLADPKDHAARVKLAQAMARLRDFAAAIEMLETAWKETRGPVFPPAMAAVVAEWIKSANSRSPSQRRAMLQQGLTWDAQNAALLRQVLDPGMLQVAPAEAPATSTIAGTAVLGLCQAVAACRSNQPAEVRAQLERAIALDTAGNVPMAVVAANVAGFWGQSQEPDAEAALLLSTALVELRPGDPLAQGAHGLVLARQEQWYRAVYYLTAALKARPADRTLHTALAGVYDNLGHPNAAAEQRRLESPSEKASPAALK